ncbi:MAG: hypothetical protein JRI80_14415 [Deltaproteobacteria bacterium]|nr:hypothetical protein [Deltaproteobacteria bacterium]
MGRVRCAIDDQTLTICSINIFPEFERHGYARATIEMFKKEFDIIIADRVRYKAIGFWEKMGFIDQGDGSFVYGVSLTLESMKRGEVRHSPNTGQVSKRMEAF